MWKFVRYTNLIGARFRLHPRPYQNHIWSIDFVHDTYSGKEIIFTKPKSKRSEQRVSLPSLTVETLRKHKIEQSRHRLAIGPAYQNLDLVVCREDGMPFNPRSFSNQFRAYADRFGMPNIRFYDLRHSHASQLLKQGVHPKVVSERLGHANIGITLDAYSHVLPGVQEEVVEQFDQILRSVMTDQKANK